ncbi:MAG: hypothetical protein RQ736_04930 [Thiogranum sp.]|nr:hypothetical protein [Thiogranum sp.]
MNQDNFRRFVELKLGISDMEIELDSRADARHATDLMVEQATFSLDIFSRDLDPFIYERASILQAISRLCRDNRKNRIRFLVNEPVAATRHAPRLIEMSRKLSSSIEIRQPHPDYLHYNEAFLVADECGLIHRDFSDRYEGTVNFYAPVEAARKLAYFTEVWERSTTSPEFRRLYL